MTTSDLMLQAALHDANEALSDCEWYEALLKRVEDDDEELYNELLIAYANIHDIAFEAVGVLIGMAMRHNNEQQITPPSD